MLNGRSYMFAPDCKSCISTTPACRTSPHALKVQQLLTNGECVPDLFSLQPYTCPKSVDTKGLTSLHNRRFPGLAIILCCVPPGPCFTVTPKGFFTPSHWLASKHAEYLRGDGVKGAKADQNAEVICQSLRAGFGRSPFRVELFFVPINAVSGT